MATATAVRPSRHPSAGPRPLAPITSALLLAVSILFFDQPTSSMINLPGFAGHRQEKVFWVVFVICLLTVRKVPSLPWQFLLLACWGVLSLTWGTDAGVDWPQAEELLIFVVAGSVIAANLDTERVIKTFHVTTVFAGLASLALGFAMPGISHDTESGYTSALHGIYIQKNYLGMVMLLGAIAALYRPVDTSRRRTILFCSVAFYLVVLLYSDSATSLALYCLAIVLRLLYWRTGRSPATSRMTVLSFLVFVPFLVVPLWQIFSPSLFHLLGRNSSLTGRTGIWEGTVAAWKVHPLAGYGWGEFTHNLRLIAILTQYNGWTGIAHAHDGYLQVLVLLGLVGLGLLLLAVVRLVREVFFLSASPHTLSRGWLITVTLTLLVYNLDETFISGMPLLILVLATYQMRADRLAQSASADSSIPRSRATSPNATPS